MANTFQGHFPDHNSAEDGFVGTAPVASFPPNGYGLYDLAGNAWEWTSDWYQPNYYKTVCDRRIARNPKGPQDSFDPAEPGVPKRVHRGGSFLCKDQYCSRYAPGGRGKGALDTGTNHLGFRCVRDAANSASVAWRVVPMAPGDAQRRNQRRDEAREFGGRQLHSYLSVFPVILHIIR
jgi:sulfatase modifying factor 1